MQKVYRLLRNNQELGPYTLEELLQKELKPLDLIWIEGKSAAWAYPYELEALKAYAPAPPRQAPGPSPSSAVQRTPADNSERHIFVSLPERPRKPAARPAVDPLEQRAEAIRQRAQQFQPVAAALPDAALRTNYAQSLDSAEEAYTQWYYNKKKAPKRRHYRGLMLVALTGAMVAGGLFAGQSLLKSSANMQQPKAPTQQAAPVVTVQKEQAPEQTLLPADTLINPTDSTTATTPKPSTGGTAAALKEPAGAKQQAAVPPVAEQTVVAITEAAPETKEATPVATPETTTQPEATVATTEKKKKGLFGGLFRKKEEAKGNGEAEEARERKASRRTGSQPATSASGTLTDRIELRSDASRENWMLGVMGQKLTLVNHNSQAIRSAVVEVFYFGEDNTLLERKKVNFGSVAAKDKATVALPDHRQAARVTFQVLSAEE